MTEDSNNLLDAQTSALRKAGLTIGDPREQDNLLERVPDGVEPIGILNSYEFREEKVRCAVCARRQQHNLGITLQLPDGQKALCGSDCAEDLYGPDVWLRLDRDFQARQREVVLKEVVAPMADLLKRIRAVAGPWFGPAKAIREFVKDLQETAPAFMESLQERMRRHDGRLEDGEGRLIWTVVGGACLLDDAVPILTGVGEKLRTAEEILERKAAKIEDLELLSQIKGGLRASLYQASDLIIAGYQFIDAENLRGIVKWANIGTRAVHRHRVTRDQDGMPIYEIGTGKHDVWEIAIPNLTQPLDVEDRLRIARLFS